MTDPKQAQVNLRRTWANNLRWRRREVGLSQLELAELLGLTQQAISRWELGTSVPPDEYRAEIAAHLATDVRTLFPYPGESAA